MKEGIITASALSIGYRQGRQGKKIVQADLDFSLERGTLTCLLGPNGAGKSTLLRTLGGSQKPLGGLLTLEGQLLEHYSERELSRQIGLVLTDKTYAGGLLVKELVALGRHPHSGFFGRLDQDDYHAVDEALRQAGISHKAESYLAELSDGERQKVMIAKALAQECPIILLDEPTAFLDVVSRIEIMNLLHGLAASGKTILLSSHDIEQALLLADRLWLLSKENGLTSGTTEDLILDGELGRLFERGKITFDPLSGSFRSQTAQGMPISVEATGELLFWTKNALMRKGYRIAAPGEKTSLKITPLSPDRIEISEADAASTTVDSFGALIDHLKNNRHG